MNGICHRWIAGKALQYLPREAHEYWQDKKEMLEDASCFPDIFWPGEKSDPVYLKKYPRWQ